MVKCSGYPDTKACPPLHLLSAIFFQYHQEERWNTDVQTRRNISKTVEDIGSVAGVDLPVADSMKVLGVTLTVA